MAFAVLHTKKYHNLIQIGKHIDRLHISDNVDGRRSQYNEELLHAALDGNIDKERSHLNEEIVKPEFSLSEDVNKRIKEGYDHRKKDGTLRKVKSDAVKAVGVILSGSHEKIKEIEENTKLFQEWKKSNFDFCSQEFGRENIVRFTLHMDEKTPHFHVVFVPITPEKRLSYERFLGTPEKMKRLQDRYAEAMRPFGLKRGISKQITGKVHKEVSEWYKEQRRTAQQTLGRVELNRLGVAKENMEREDLRKNNEQLRRDLSQIMEDRIRKDLNEVKKNVNLVQHAASMGYKIDKKKSSRKWINMEKGADKILVMGAPNDHGNWYYKSVVNDSDKGSIVDFMKNRGYSFESVRKLSSLHLDDEVLYYVQKAKSKVGRKEAARTATQKLLTYELSAQNYLAKQRGIKNETSKRLNVRSNQEGAIFSLKLEGKICSTIEYKSDGEKRFQAGLERGVCLLGKEKNAKNIIIFESPLDAMSYEQMRYEAQGRKCENLYLSTCGSIGKVVGEEIKKVVLEHPKAMIYVAFDNDIAGKRMSEEVKKLLKNQEVKVQKPRMGKDFNAMLLLLEEASCPVYEEEEKKSFEEELEEQRMGISRKRRYL